MNTKQASLGFEGFETFYNAFQMTKKMYFVVFIWTIILFFFSVAAVSYFVIGLHAIKVMIVYGAALLTEAWPNPAINFPNPDGTITRLSAYTIAHTPQVINYVHANLDTLKTIAAYCIFSLFAYPALIFWFRKRAGKQTEKTYIRGAKLITAKEYNAEVKKNKIKTDLPFGDVKMPVTAETKHTLIIGKPGSGKTVLMSAIIDRLRQREEKGLIYDFKGDYLSRFYDPSTDLIFNPLDQRSLGWNMFNELKTKMDIDAISASLIPPSISTSDPFWNDAARDVFSGMLHFLNINNLRSNQDIWSFLCSPGKDIAACLATTPGGERGHRYIEDAGSKQALSVFAVMMQYCKCFEYMAVNDGDFSIKDWLENGSGMIFITNYADLKEPLMPILSLFIDLFSRKLLSMPDSYTRSLPIILDEFGTLQRLSSILQLLTLSRSKGGKCFIGIQDFGQITKLYGAAHCQSIVNACGNAAIFSMADPEAAKRASDKLGEAEYREIQKNVSMGVQSLKDGVSFSERKLKESIFLNSEIMDMPELTTVVKFVDHHPVKTKLIYTEYNDNAEPFLMADGLELPGPQPVEGVEVEEIESFDEDLHEDTEYKDPYDEDIEDDELTDDLEKIDEIGSDCPAMDDLEDEEDDEHAA